MTRVNGILHGALLDTQAVKFEVYCQHLLDGKDFLPILQCDLFLDVWSKLQRSCWIDLVDDVSIPYIFLLQILKQPQQLDVLIEVSFYVDKEQIVLVHSEPWTFIKTLNWLLWNIHLHFIHPQMLRIRHGHNWMKRRRINYRIWLLLLPFLCLILVLSLSILTRWLDHLDAFRYSWFVIGLNRWYLLLVVLDLWKWFQWNCGSQVGSLLVVKPQRIDVGRWAEIGPLVVLALAIFDCYWRPAFIGYGWLPSQHRNASGMRLFDVLQVLNIKLNLLQDLHRMTNFL